MMMKVCFLTMLALVHGNQSEVTPVQKVVALLQGMLEKGKKEKYDEQVTYAAFKEFCESELGVTQQAIDEESVAIEHFTVDIRKERTVAELLAREARRLDGDVSVWEGDMKAATNVRQMEKATFGGLYEDYSESVDALIGAIEVLKKQGHDHSQQSGLVQIAALTNMTLIPASAKKAIDAFVQTSRNEDKVLEGLVSSAPEGNAYEFQSAGIIDMLKKLLDTFMDQRRNLQSEEEKGKAAYDKLLLDLHDQIDSAKGQKNRKLIEKAKQLAMKADNKGERVDEYGLRRSDKHFLKDLFSQCKVKSSAFKSRQELRANEIVALEKAINILSSNAVSGNADKHLRPAMLQKNGTALAALRSSSKNWNQVALYLQEQGVKLNSRLLETVAVHASKDPFTKVKKMIKDLLTKLVEQASEEAEHKGWCDTELTNNGQTRNEKTASVDHLNSEIDQLVASIAKLAENIGELRKAVAELDTAMAEQTKLRNEEKAKNKETIKDAGEAQVAVEKALAVLRDFYAEAGEATDFLQKKATHHDATAPAHKKGAAGGSTAYVQKGASPDPVPKKELFDNAYQGMGEASVGVLGMLEVIESDFAHLETSTKAAEETSQKEFHDFMYDAKASKATKSTDLEHMEAAKQGTEGKLTDKQRDLAGTQKELDAALSYFEKLKPSCVDAGVDYEERVLRRKEEIESLESALRILEGEEIP